MAQHTKKHARRKKRRAVRGILFTALLLVAVILAAVLFQKGFTDTRERLTQRTTVVTANSATTTHTQPSATTTAAVVTSKVLTDVPLICQMPAFPTGCESVSTVIAMQYAGESITVDTFVDTYLEKAEFYTENGVKYGPDPHKQFVGSPRSAAGYGCYAPVIVKALDRYYGKTGVAVDCTGTDLSALCTTYIAHGTPCIVWTSIGMAEPRYTSKWRLADGTNFTWIGNEHCMVLVGYDEKSYYFSDPYTGKRLQYNRALCEQRYAAYGKQAVVIQK